MPYKDNMVKDCNPNEAPEGYYAVPKKSLDHDSGNLCRQCDWRTTCNDPHTDLLAYGHRCMGHAIIALRDGKTYQREDKCSVVFKLK
jgi:hypothetical protein